MKTKVTKKQILNSYANVISVGYCRLQNLLSYESERHYTTGVYGWNADIYEINSNTVIVTGYRPFGKSVSSDIIKEYKDKAALIKSNCNLSCEVQKTRLSTLLNELIAKAI